MFEERPLLNRRKPVYGLGINDADYVVRSKLADGTRAMCPYYTVWMNMLRRVTSEPDYADVTICNEWITFSRFKEWMTTQDWEGKFLDKDLLDPNSRTYSPDTCLFVDRHVNNVIRNNKGTGVTKRKNRYVARYGSNNRHIGSYVSESDAIDAYKSARLEHISSLALEYDEPIRSALLRMT